MIKAGYYLIHPPKCTCKFGTMDIILHTWNENALKCTCGSTGIWSIVKHKNMWVQLSPTYKSGDMAIAGKTKKQVVQNVTRLLTRADAS